MPKTSIKKNIKKKIKKKKTAGKYLTMKVNINNSKKKNRKNFKKKNHVNFSLLFLLLQTYPVKKKKIS
jgi:hypothetical protein